MGVVLAGLGAATPASAACVQCNSYVVLTPFRANCFLERAGAELQRLRSEKLGVIVVDLADCPQIGSKPPSSIVALPAGGAPRPDTSFIVDEPTLTCLWNEVLYRMLGVGEISDDKSSMRFDIVTLCP